MKSKEQTSIREIHGVRWKDTLAWMEDMKGPQWNSLLHKYQVRWKNLCKRSSLDSEIKLIQNEIVEARTILTTPLFRAGNSVEIEAEGTNSILWNWKGQQGNHAADLDWCRKFPSLVWVTEDNSSGRENYTLKCYEKGKEKAIWEKGDLGPFVAVVRGRCYALESKNKLIYWRLVSWNCVKGDDYRIHYEEKDSRYNLEIIRCSCSTFYLKRQSGPKEDLFEIGEEIKLVDGISLESRRFVLDISEPGKYFVWTMKDGWRNRGVTAYGLEFSKETNPEILWSERNILITRCRGKRVIWRIGKKMQKLWEGYANIMVDKWGGPWVRLAEPLGTTWWNTEADLRPHSLNQIGCEMSVNVKGDITYLLIEPETGARSAKKPSLLVAAYGAYGLPTPLMTNYWRPLLHRGWTICIVLLRGGGDYSPDMEDSGRTTGRLQVLEEAANLIQEAQKKTGISPERTVVYGRSAGGLWAGGIVAKYGTKLIGGAYMEVPYLDVLRTTTNRGLPLTDLETDEFGNPGQRLADFIEMMKWSPMELLEQDNSLAKGVKQIVRTGLNDSEVFAYESVKWVERCGQNAYLAVEDGQGHFVSGQKMLEQKAIDLAVLDFLISS